MKLFNLEEALNGASLVTDDGKTVRMISHDRMTSSSDEEFSIVCLVTSPEWGGEDVRIFSSKTGKKYTALYSTSDRLHITEPLDQFFDETISVLSSKKPYINDTQEKFMDKISSIIDELTIIKSKCMQTLKDS